MPGTAMDAAVDCGTSIIVIPPAVATTFYSNIPGTVLVEEGIYAIPCNTTLDVGVKIAGRTFPIKVEDLAQGYLDEAGTMCVVGVFGFDVSYFFFSEAQRVLPPQLNWCDLGSERQF